MAEWLKIFMKDYFLNRDDSYKLKQSKVPKRLFKYQPINDKIREERLGTLKENKVWLTKADYLNDPYDCQAIYYNKEKLLKTIIENNIPEKISKKPEYIIEYLEKGLKMFKSNLAVTCFSEQEDNMPMWANYADNHAGICIEYDFSNLPIDSDFGKMLYPMVYEEERYDISNILIDQATARYQKNPYVLFFLTLMKHSSWRYEKEWRFIAMDIEQKYEFGFTKELPIQPTAIYFGINCREEDINDITRIVKGTSIKLYKNSLQNNEFFHLKKLEGSLY